MECHYVFIIFDARTGSARTGVTCDLRKEVAHGGSACQAQTPKPRLLYYEVTDAEQAALARVRQIRRWRMERKFELIASMNPQWDDLSLKW